MSAPVSEQDKCSYCQIACGRANLRKCGKCKFPRYCSKECQAGAWPTHKASCVVTAQCRELLLEDPARKAKHDALTWWINWWKFNIDQTALAALNLANNPAEDYLATHSVVMALEPLPNPRHRANSFRVYDLFVLGRIHVTHTIQMKEGSVMNDEEWIQRMRDMGVEESTIENWVKDRRGNYTVRINISTSEGFLRFIYFTIPDGGETRRGMDRSLSNDLAAFWAESLAFSFENDRGPVIFD